MDRSLSNKQIQVLACHQAPNQGKMSYVPIYCRCGVELGTWLKVLMGGTYRASTYPTTP